MPKVREYTQQELQCAHSPDLAVRRPVNLPFGGPTGAGGKYAQGLGLSIVGAAAAAEVVTLTFTTVSSGTWALIFDADKPYMTATLAFNVSLANLKTALETIFGTGSIASVTGTPGSSYVITWAVNQRIGGNFRFVNNTNGTLAAARTTRGSVGPGQFDVYDGSTFTTIDRLLIQETSLDPTGARVTDIETASGQPYFPASYTEGFFYAADIPNLLAGAVGNDKKLGFSEGAAITDAGCVLRLSQKN